MSRLCKDLESAQMMAKSPTTLLLVPVALIVTLRR